MCLFYVAKAQSRITIFISQWYKQWKCFYILGLRNVNVDVERITPHWSPEGRFRPVGELQPAA